VRRGLFALVDLLEGPRKTRRPRSALSREHVARRDFHRAPASLHARGRRLLREEGCIMVKIENFGLFGSMSLALASLVFAAGCGSMNVPSAPAGAPDLEPPPALMAREVAKVLGPWTFGFNLGLASESKNVADKQMVDEVMAKLAKGDRGDAIEWDVRIVEDDTADAVAFPGGGVIVNSGLLRHAKGDPGMVSVVLSHEIAHVRHNHFAFRLEQQADLLKALWQVAPSIPSDGVPSELRATSLVAMGVAFEGAAAVPFMKDQEREADTRGVDLMRAGGYEPDLAVKFWQQTVDERGGGGLSLFHPTSQERLDSLKKVVAASASAPQRTAEVD
jgi:Zn-dependent protease with chaperone function